MKLLIQKNAKLLTDKTVFILIITLNNYISNNYLNY
jgi:hypothetical protein